MSVMVNNLRNNEAENFSRIRSKFGTYSPELPEAVQREEKKLFQAASRAFVRGLLQKFSA